MTTFGPEENTCYINAIKYVSLRLGSLVIAEIGRLKGIRVRNLSWFEVVGGQITDHVSGLVGVAYDMSKWH